MREGASTAEIQLLTEEQAEVVRETLHSIMNSPLFAKSKRYPALLEYLVLHALDGGEFSVKERTIGTDVFGRPASYEPGMDPIVRVAAGEVRRRIQVYYSEHPDAPVRIEFPPGQYNALFHFRPLPADASWGLASNPSTQQHIGAPVPPLLIHAPAPPVHVLDVRWNRRAMIALMALLAIFATIGTTVWRTKRAHPQSLLSSVLSASGPTLIVLGERSQASIPQPPAPGAQIPGTSIANATTAVLICDVFRDYGRTCDLLPATLSHLTDLQKKTVVFIGSDNDWTRRVLTPLRFQFNSRVNATTVDSISDYGNASGQRAVWTNTTLGTNYTDYAVVATFHSDITDGTAVVEAGLTANGTLGAAQFMSDPESTGQIFSRAPKGWKGMNFEALVQIDVVQGAPGHAKVLGAQFW